MDEEAGSTGTVNNQPQSEHSTADYANWQPPQKPEKWKKRLIIFIGLVLLLAAGSAVYWLALKKKPAASPGSSAQPTTTASETKPISPQTKNYASQNFTLSFDYPDDWTVTDEPGSGIMSVKSPALQLTEAGGQKITGQITLTFRAKTQKLTEFDPGSAVAVRDSEKIAYTKPTQSQRGNTYLSFLRYAKTADSAALDGIYITGDAGYKKDQDIPLADLTKVDPVVSLTFAKCPDSTCSNTTPLSIAASSWGDSTLSGPLEAMLKSLTIT